MKFILLLITFFLNTQIAYSAQFKSDLKFDLLTGLSKKLIITCDNQEQLCTELCAKQDACHFEETLCADCGTEKSQEVHMIYNQLDNYIEATSQIVSSHDLGYFLNNKKFLTISYDFFLNYFNPESSSDLALVFNNICKTQSVNNLILVEIEEQKNTISSIVGAICTDEHGFSLLRNITLNSNYSTESDHYWRKINQEYNIAISTFKLRYDFNLLKTNNLTTSNTKSVSSPESLNLVPKLKMDYKLSH